MHKKKKKNITTWLSHPQFMYGPCLSLSVVTHNTHRGHKHVSLINLPFHENNVQK